MSELERIYDAARLPTDPQRITASEDECRALAWRFALVSVGSLEATITLVADGLAVLAQGRLMAEVVQSCAVSGEELAVRIDEPVALRFIPAIPLTAADEEIELTADELDEIEMDGTRFDLGEAVAQTMALAIDPYLEGPNAEEFRRKAGILSASEGGAFAALKGLLKE
jgi:uncharacterized metal-binding protein YceD (DUF177 family)